MLILPSVNVLREVFLELVNVGNYIATRGFQITICTEVA